MEKPNYLSKLMKKTHNHSEEFYKKISETLTPEERNYIKKNLKNKSYQTCLNATCRVETIDQICLDEFGKPKGNDCLGWTNDILVGKSKILILNNINKFR